MLFLTFLLCNYFSMVKRKSLTESFTYPVKSKLKRTLSLLVDLSRILHHLHL